MPITKEREHSIVDAVETLLDVATSSYPDRQSEETLTECHMCGKWEEHSTTCPVPYLEQWQKGDQ